MVRFCLVPVVLSSTGGRLPKYFVARFSPPSTPSIKTIPAIQDYGREPSMLVAADLTDADAIALAAQPDVTMFPVDLDVLVGADLASLQTALTALKLPGGMVTANTPYRKVVRGILGIFGIAQCTDGKGVNLFAAGVTLGSTLVSLPQAVRDALTGCMDSAGYDTTGLTDVTTIRQVLIGIANTASPFTLLGVTV